MELDAPTLLYLLSSARYAFLRSISTIALWLGLAQPRFRREKGYLFLYKSLVKIHPFSLRKSIVLVLVLLVLVLRFFITYNRPVGVSFTWCGFISGGSRHKDGWGVAFYPDGISAYVIKEPRPSTSSPVIQFLMSADLIRSKILISRRPTLPSFIILSSNS